MKPEVLIGAAAGYGILAYTMHKWPFDSVVAGAGYSYGGGGGGKGKGGGGGYAGTPGWYTAVGHHHCQRGQAGCVCTDPKKCLGIRGTGSQLCKNGACAPGPGQCRPDLGRYGATPCADCPPGTGGGKCAAGGAFAGVFDDIVAGVGSIITQVFAAAPKAPKAAAPKAAKAKAPKAAAGGGGGAGAAEPANNRATDPEDIAEDTGGGGGAANPVPTTGATDCATYCKTHKAGAAGQLAEAVYPTDLVEFLWGNAAKAKKGGGKAKASKGGYSGPGAAPAAPKAAKARKAAVPKAAKAPEATPADAGTPDSGTAPPDTTTAQGVPPCDCSTINKTASAAPDVAGGVASTDYYGYDPEIEELEENPHRLTIS